MSEEEEEKAWIGAIYLKDEGGYRIVLKSLHHYKKRLRTIGHSPELKSAAAMFGPVLVQQAAKTIPKINEAVLAIQECLDGTRQMDQLREEVPFLKKSLSCYEADILKARDSGYDYFVELVGDMREAEGDLASIGTALERLGQFS